MDGIYEFVSSLWVVWLVLLFAGIVAYALWPGNRRKFRQAARIPLDDEDEAPRDDAPDRQSSQPPGDGDVKGRD
jgi:cytochrome c oxidase cbb3-type subunit 4